MARSSATLVAVVALLCAAACLLGGGVQAQPSATTQRITRLVVLMMENRSFDHLLGWSALNRSDINGLTGNEYNLIDPTNSTSERVYVNQHGRNVAPSDPQHDFVSTTQQIFGNGSSVTGDPEVMSGFVANSFENHLNYTTPMSMFTDQEHSAPIINLLAREFITFDAWYPSLPGPTDPNRAFVMSGTSNGMIENYNGTKWSQQSFFDFLTEHNRTWGAYYDDDPWAIMYFSDINKTVNRPRVKQIEHFFSEVAAGELNQFTFLQPRMHNHINGVANWQHPDAPLREGERLIKRVYESLRQSSLWEETALLLTYDEHGGFYDHVAPPDQDIPPPGPQLASNGFAFDRLGVRVPALLISPWSARGLVVHEPTGAQLTTPSSHFEHTSVIATARRLLGIDQPLTQRDAWAATFDSLFAELAEPRTDCPVHLPEVPLFPAHEIPALLARPINDHQAIQVRFYCAENQREANCADEVVTQADAAAFFDREIPVYMRRFREQS